MAKYFVDFYELMDLDRTLDTLSLHKKIRQLINIKRKQRSFTQGGDKSQKLAKEIDLYNNALKYFATDESRNKYDIELSQATVKNETFRKKKPVIDDLFENALVMFNNQRYDMASEILEELLKQTSNNEKAWLLFGDAKYMMGDYDDALNIMNRAAKAFPMSVDLRFRAIRFNILLDYFNEAQALLNNALVDFPNHPLFTSEQIYLYLAAGKLDLVKKFIDEYISKKPSNSEFRRLTAENLIDIATQHYVIDSESGQRFPITQAKYDFCFKLITWANQLWQDQGTLAELSHIRELGCIQFDYSQIRRILICIGISIALMCFSFKIARGDIKEVFFSPLAVLIILLLCTAFAIWRKSRRPLWMKYRDSLRGYSDAQLSGDFI